MESRCSTISPEFVMTNSKTIHAQLAYQTNGQDVTEPVKITVADGCSMGEWIMALADYTRDLITPKGAENGYLTYRLDGSDAPLTLWERVQDRWHRLTWRGTPITGARFVPIWPSPAG
jgi:hypothetical protein